MQKFIRTLDGQRLSLFAVDDFLITELKDNTFIVEAVKHCRECGGSPENYILFDSTNRVECVEFLDNLFEEADKE